jgi:galactokinase
MNIQLVTDSGTLEVHTAHQSSSNSIEVRAPGRINLIGEHTDYNGGKVLPCAIDPALTITLAPNTGDTLRIESETLGCYVCLSLNGIATIALQAADSESFLRILLADLGESAWCSYIVGAWCKVSELCEHANTSSPGACTLRIKSDIPLGGGLSSSAALCVGALKVFMDFTGTSCDELALAKSAMHIEHIFAGTRCGLMDQLAIVSAKEGMFSLIDFLNANEPTTTLIPAQIALKGYTLIALNSGVAHSLASGEYNKRRLDCEQAVSILNAFADTSFQTLGDFATEEAFAELWKLPRTTQTIDQVLTRAFTLSDTDQQRLYKRTRHALGEVLRVDSAAEALRNSNLSLLAELMVQAHCSLRDDYEVSCEEIESLRDESLHLASSLFERTHDKTPAIIGPRLCGGGFGGSIIQLVHNSISTQFANYFSGNSQYEKTFGIKPKVLVTSIAEGMSSTTHSSLAA